MSFHSQTQIGLSVEACDSCGETFWISPSSAHKVRASGKSLLCRNCQEMTFLSVYPYPYCRRLTDEEIEEFEYECFLMNRIDRLELPTPPAPTPSPVMETDSSEDLRSRVRSVLEIEGISKKEFAASIGLKDYDISNFLSIKDYGRTGPARKKVESIAAGVRRLSGGLPETPEKPRDPVLEHMTDAVFGDLGKPKSEVKAEPVEEPEDSPTPPATVGGRPLPGSGESTELPFPGVTEFETDDRKGLWKYMANALARAKSLPHNKAKEAEIDKEIEKAKREVARPEGDYRYDTHDMYEANPINKLTQDEKLTCIRSLPLPIVQKLFPSL